MLNDSQILDWIELQVTSTIPDHKGIYFKMEMVMPVGVSFRQFVSEKVLAGEVVYNLNSDEQTSSM